MSPLELYNKALRQMPGSPAQESTIAQIHEMKNSNIPKHSIGSKVRVNTTKSAMNLTPVQMDLTIGWIDRDELGQVIYRGTTAKGRARWFNENDIV